jgi:hypothetical protein
MATKQSCRSAVSGALARDRFRPEGSVPADAAGRSLSTASTRAPASVGVIASPRTRSRGADHRGDRFYSPARVRRTIAKARGCRRIPSGCTKVTTAFWGDLTGARQAAEAELPRPKWPSAESTSCHRCTRTRRTPGILRQPLDDPVVLLRAGAELDRIVLAACPEIGRQVLRLANRGTPSSTIASPAWLSAGVYAPTSARVRCRPHRTKGSHRPRRGIVAPLCGRGIPGRSRLAASGPCARTRAGRYERPRDTRSGTGGGAASADHGPCSASSDEATLSLWPISATPKSSAPRRY